jgi:hypothetical protein
MQFNLGTRRRRTVNFMLHPLCFPWKGPLVCIGLEVVSDGAGLNIVQKKKSRDFARD